MFQQNNTGGATITPDTVIISGVRQNGKGRQQPNAGDLLSWSCNSAVPLKQTEQSNVFFRLSFDPIDLLFLAHPALYHLPSPESLRLDALWGKAVILRKLIAAPANSVCCSIITLRGSQAVYCAVDSR